MINTTAHKYHKIFPYAIVSAAFVGYGVIFAIYHHKAGNGLGSLAIIPVIAASWYIGTTGGIVTALVSILMNFAIVAIAGHSTAVLYQDPGNLIGSFALIFVAFVTGRFSAALHERRDAIRKLEQYELERASHTKFLEALNQITARALQADSLNSTLGILIEQIANLFRADDAFFAFWDEIQQIPIPTSAHGSMKDVYPYMQFERSEITPTSSVMKVEQPIFIADIENSSHISAKIAAIFPSRSMLCIPLIAQQHKLGAIILGYNRTYMLKDDDLFHAEIVAEQVALVLSKSQLLEDERKQVRQLTALHDVAVISIEADNEDQLIEQATGIIGQNLFPDNFGVMLLDEQAGTLRAHPSYRFYLAEDLKMQDVPLGMGITGQVASNGQSQRIGNVRRIPQYIDVDDRTISELCVPIKFKERILGVINAESTKRDAFTTDDERLLVTLAGQLATAIEQLRKAQAERLILNELAHAKDLIYSIAQIATQIEGSLDPDQIIQTFGVELEKIGLTCIMAVYDATQKYFTINFTSLQPQLLEIVENGLGYPLIKYTFPRHRLDSVLKKEDMLRPAVLSDLEEEIHAVFTHVNKPGVAPLLEKIGVSNGMEPLRLPLMFEENLLGILWLWGQDITKSDLPILSILAKQIGVSLERARLFQEVQSLALTDPLTGLQNRRNVFELGRVEFSRAQRMERPFSCIMLDLDHFKKINDNYGHQVGDDVLQAFAHYCLASVREIDFLGRYGGEEFILLLPETDRDTAVRVAERLRKSVAEKPIKTSGGDVNITVSVGVATKDEQTTNFESLIARADQALYISKHKGRNRVSISK